MAWELAKFYGDPLPDPEMRQKLIDANRLYEQNDEGG